MGNDWGSAEEEGYKDYERMGKDWGSAEEEGYKGDGGGKLNTGGYSASVNINVKAVNGDK